MWYHRHAIEIFNLGEFKILYDIGERRKYVIKKTVTLPLKYDQRCNSNKRQWLQFI